MTYAHVGGIPLEETLGLYGPALVLVAGAASASLGARLRRIGRRRNRHSGYRGREL
jgi:hypothetical protein